MARGLEHKPLERAGCPPGMPALSLKFWVYQLERAPSCHIIWDLPRLQEVVFRGMPEGAREKDWVRNGIDDESWPKYARQIGVGEGHYQRGSQGAETAARNRGTLLPGLILATLTAEPGATTPGVIVAVLHFAYPINKKQQRPEAPDNGTKAQPGLSIASQSVI